MKYIVILYFLFLALGCSNALDKETYAGIAKTQNDNLNIDSTKKNNGDRKQKIIKDSDLIHIDTISIQEFSHLKKISKSILLENIQKEKIDGKVQIYNKNGVVVKEYNDSLVGTDDTDQKEYNIIGEFKNQGFTILSVQYYESGECILVNNESGTETVLWGIPKLSPDGKYLFVGTCTLGYEEIVPNGYQIWKIIDDKNVKLVYEANEKTWCIQNFYWIENQELAIEAKNNKGGKYFLKFNF